VIEREWKREGKKEGKKREIDVMSEMREGSKGERERRLCCFLWRLGCSRRRSEA